MSGSELFQSSALKDQTALVTGGAAGIGAATVRALVSAGASTYFFDKDTDAGAALAAETGATFIALDLTAFGSVEAALAKLGPIDILVNNAGVDQHAFFTATTPDDWQALLKINLEAVFAATQGVLPGMQARQSGRIINIASEAGRQGSKGGAIYAAAKGGVLAFTKSIARENARYQITCNAICPGPIETPLLQAAVKDHGGDKLEQAMTDATLLKRLGRPDEVAALVVFLAAPAAGYITGEIIGVSGGMGC